MKKLIHNKLVWFCLLIVVVLIVNYYQTERKNEVVFANRSHEKRDDEEKKTESNKEISAPAQSKVFMVDVKGAIQKPSVIECKEGDRVIDVIKLAGGFQKKADVNKVNLAEKVSDEMVIYVPLIGEETEGVSASMASTNNNTEKNVAIDINHATQSELEKIPGIGPTKAKNILDYIESNGPLTSVEQLDAVNGIGKKSLEQMTPFILIR
ncbi:helix-hairpin-helix domain-containing protein [Bacillus sp. AFS017336]|uniref:helix-hairpin-helix domain-containing protein n=1 Tax=Bacillus sp. AFS017336 TaxID=2033489 RepID=UPI000BF16039|nr:helix-hairpin-helix domain-containing protein [Bacillus sp. AFS017336]PEL14147.1 hypothetical protein CN601_00945 [Bacillus sp. AFS017336]